jgi:hypothetical protein
VDGHSIREQYHPEDPIIHVGHRAPQPNSAIVLHAPGFRIQDYLADPGIFDDALIRSEANSIEISRGLHRQRPCQSVEIAEKSSSSELGIDFGPDQSKMPNFQPNRSQFFAFQALNL